MPDCVVAEIGAAAVSDSTVESFVGTYHSWSSPFEDASPADCRFCDF